MKILNILTAYVTLLLLICQSIGCKKFVEAPPPATSINAENVFQTDATAISALTSNYASISAGGFTGGGINSLSFFPGLSADELTIFGSSSTQFEDYYLNNLNAKDAGYEYWNSFYPLIYNNNAAIEGLTKSSDLTPAVKQQLIGEAKFMRAFCYFYLVNLYGSVPLSVNTNYKENAGLSRAPTSELWQQIISDLSDSQTLLSSDYLGATLLNNTIERIRPTKGAATALLARAYLYTGDYIKAAKEASQLIDNNPLYKLSALNSVFLANSTEAIWQLQPVQIGQNTPDALTFILPASGPDGGSWPVYLNPELIQSFEPGDQRLTNWIDSTAVNGITYYYPFKYKVNTLDAEVTEYEMVLRLGEQYLIRAESNAQPGGNLTQAIADLNTIRNRAGLPNTSMTSQADVLAAILRERRVEFFTEWGHRWLDLKRTGKADAIMSIATHLKGGSWNSNAQLYPLPLSDLITDPNLIQNAGY